MMRYFLTKSMTALVTTLVLLSSFSQPIQAQTDEEVRDLLRRIFGSQGQTDRDAASSITCESQGNRTKRCPFDTRNGVVLVRQLSNTSCQGNWSYGQGYIEVRNGCRAEFVRGWRPPYGSRDRDYQRIENTLSAWGRNCQREVAQKFSSDVSMADIRVEVGATLQQSLDAGQITYRDLRRHGASFNWSVRKKRLRGYCNTDGNGNVTQFKIN